MSGAIMNRLEIPNNIILAVESGQLSIVETVLSEDPSLINFQDDATGLTGLHVAVADGAVAIARYLLSVPHIDPTIRDFRGRDALDLAIGLGHQPLIQMISRSVYPASFEGPRSQPSIP